MRVDKEYKLAYHIVVPALSREKNELLTGSFNFKRS